MAYDEEAVTQAMPIKSSTETVYGRVVKADGYVSASMEAVRIGFIRKVYSVLVIQLAPTTAVSAVCCLLLYKALCFDQPTPAHLGLHTKSCTTGGFDVLQRALPNQHSPVVCLDLRRSVHHRCSNCVLCRSRPRNYGCPSWRANFVHFLCPHHLYVDLEDRFQFYGPMLFSCLIGMILYSLAYGSSFSYDRFGLLLLGALVPWLCSVRHIPYP